MTEESESIADEQPPRPAWRFIIFLALAMFVLILGVAVLEYPVLFTPSPFIQFISKDTNYYAQVAHACDLLQVQHPANPANSLEISGHDASLPKIIKSLRPDRVLISSNKVVIQIPPYDMGGFALIWAESDIQSNQWNLYTLARGMEIFFQEPKQKQASK